MQRRKRGCLPLALPTTATVCPEGPAPGISEISTVSPSGWKMSGYCGAQRPMWWIMRDIWIFPRKTCGDWVVASIHSCCMPEGVVPTRELCTRLWLEVAKNPYVNVIGHSGSPDYAYDYERVIPEFGRNGKLVEINSHSFEVRASYIPNCREIARLCMKYRVPVIVNSDAHFSASVLDCSAGLEMLEEMGFPEELIINSSEERFRNYLKEHTNFWK